MKKSPVLRMLSGVLCLCFTLQQASADILLQPNSGASFREKIRMQMPVSLPERLGTVIDYFPGTSDKFVIHILDAHSSLEAQKSIHAILRHLTREKKIKTLFLEGATRPLEPELYALHPDPQKSLEIAGHLLEMSELTGAEMFLLEQKVKDSCKSDCVQSEGIESIPEYVKNIQSYRRLKRQNALVEQTLDRLSLAASGMAKKVLNPDLRKFFDAAVGFESKRTDLPAYLQILKRNAQESLGRDLQNPRFQFGHPMLARYFQVLGQESAIDLKEVRKEKKATALFLKEKSVPENTREAVQLLPDSETSIRGVLEKLYEEASPKGFEFQKWPHWSRWAGLQGLRQELEARPLMAEIEKLSTEILGKLARHPKEKEFLNAYSRFRLLRKLLRLELERPEWQSLKTSGLAPYSPESLAEFFGGRRPGGKWQEAQKLADTAADFYSAATGREKAMLKNIEKIIKKKGGRSKVESRRKIDFASTFHLPPQLRRSSSPAAFMPKRCVLPCAKKASATFPYSRTLRRSMQKKKNFSNSP